MTALFMHNAVIPRVYIKRTFNNMTLLSILRIQTKIFINNITKLNTVLKIIYLIGFVLILFNYTQTGKFLVGAIRMHFNREATDFYETANLLFSIILLLNLVSVFFLSSGYTLTKQLNYFPITLIKIVSYEIVVGVFDISNIAFVGIFFLIYFLVSNNFVIQSFLQFLSLFILFVLLISNISLFIKNVVYYYLLFFRKNKIIQVVSFILPIVAVKLLQTITVSKINITKLSNFLNYLPSGRLLLFSYSKHSSLLFFFETSIYFLFLNLIFLIVNITLTKRLSKKRFLSIANSNRTKNSLSNFVKNSKLNPFIKKEILYHFRSIKMIFNFLILTIGYSLLIYYVITKSNYSDNKLLLEFQNLGLLLNAILIIILTGNIFRFDEQSIKAYFIFPTQPSIIINAKIRITHFFLLLNSLMVTISLIYLKIPVLNFLVFIALLFFTSYFFHYVGLLFSIYFPKKIDMNALNGLNVSVVTLIISIPILFIVFLFVQYVLSFTELLPQIIVIMFVIILSGLLYKLQITDKLGKLLNKRKTLIIETLR
jgi:hypothetical protein